MRKTIIPIVLGCIALSFTSISHFAPTKAGEAAVSTEKKYVARIDASTIYSKAGLADLGLSEEAFNHAWKGYQHLIDKNRISKENFLTICDLSQPSYKKRLYIVDINKMQVVTNTFVAHGKNSGDVYATRFSNKPESLQSSLGFYITAATYNGKHGLSLRLNGVDRGYNDKAMERTIVMHGASYVDAARAKAGVRMGRSWGCPAVPQKESAQIINMIKNGSCMFIYHPSQDYLLGSKILNV